MMKKIFFIVLMVVMILYAPFELTRILLLLNAGYTLSLPWYWVAEIFAIWIGYIIAGFVVWKSLNRIKTELD